MNWEEIDKKYPKAYRLADDYFDEEIGDNLLDILETTTRWLYDFFDEQGIWVMIFPPTSSDEGSDTFEAEINVIGDGYIVDGSYGTRAEAEEQAFIKAFEILENRL